LPFFILAIVLSVLRSFAFLYFGHCNNGKKKRKAKRSKHRQYNGQNKERQKERSTDIAMAKI
jgi:hypothetical protein